MLCQNVCATDISSVEMIRGKNLQVLGYDWTDCTVMAETCQRSN
jgi:hypothetical protein